MNFIRNFLIILIMTLATKLFADSRFYKPGEMGVETGFQYFREGNTDGVGLLLGLIVDGRWDASIGVAKTALLEGDSDNSVILFSTTLSYSPIKQDDELPLTLKLGVEGQVGRFSDSSTAVLEFDSDVALSSFGVYGAVSRKVDLSAFESLFLEVGVHNYNAINHRTLSISVSEFDEFGNLIFIEEHVFGENYNTNFTTLNGEISYVYQFESSETKINSTSPYVQLGLFGRSTTVAPFSWGIGLAIGAPI